jgi:hypothetical protein
MNDPLVYLQRDRERIRELQGSEFGKTSRIWTADTPNITAWREVKHKV